MVDISQLEKVPTFTDVQLEADKVQAKAYLQATDWYLIRLIELEIPVPSEVTKGRASARAVLNGVANETV